MSRPRIGVAAVTRARNGQHITGVNVPYVQAVLAAGGLPVLLLPECSTDEVLELFGECDALLLTGGEDVDPARYRATAHAMAGVPDHRRDANELALIADAQARDLPILGICRGIQICNVAFGGTLVQDLPAQQPSDISHDPAGARDAVAHDVEIVAGSHLHRILGATTISANSFHHQAPDLVGPGLVVTASAPDGVIEGMESADPDTWIVLVQWHPEELALHPDARDLKLFAALVQAARRE
ncbi:MAG: gamma-glutamyl-gamma-aminobutyrate hydrolase family protein [Gemmatimonadota bacterium]